MCHDPRRQPVSRPNSAGVAVAGALSTRRGPGRRRHRSDSASIETAQRNAETMSTHDLTLSTSCERSTLRVSNSIFNMDVRCDRERAPALFVTESTKPRGSHSSVRTRLFTKPPCCTRRRRSALPVNRFGVAARAAAMPTSLVGVSGEAVVDVGGVCCPTPM